jgi:hypothetical protein
MKLRNPKATKWYEYPKGDDPKLRVEVGLLSSEIKNFLLDNRQIEIVKTDPETGKKITEKITQDKRLDKLTVKYGLKGIENLTDWNDKNFSISFVKEKFIDKEYDVVSTGTIEALDTMNLVGWISAMVWDFLIVTDEEKKTSN